MNRNSQHRRGRQQVECLFVLAIFGAAIGMSIPWFNSLVADGFSRWCLLWVFPASLAIVITYFIGLPLLLAWCYATVSCWIVPEDSSAGSLSRFEAAYLILLPILVAAPVVLGLVVEIWRWFA